MGFGNIAWHAWPSPSIFCCWVKLSGTCGELYGHDVVSVTLVKEKMPEPKQSVGPTNQPQAAVHVSLTAGSTHCCQAAAAADTSACKYLLAAVCFHGIMQHVNPMRP
jgi:hypothetical protein